MSAVYIAATVLLSVYGQLIIKWQVGRLGEIPAGFQDKVDFLIRLSLNPWVISVYAAAVLAAFSWMAALSRMDLSRAYPFVGTSFVLILICSAIFFDESLTFAKITGVLLIVLGLYVGSRV